MQWVDYFHFSNEACRSQKFYNSAKFRLGALPEEAERKIPIAATDSQDAKRVEFVSVKTGWKGQKKPHPKAGWWLWGGMLKSRGRQDIAWLLWWSWAKVYEHHMLLLTYKDDHTLPSTLAGVCCYIYLTVTNYQTNPRHDVLFIFVFQVPRQTCHKKGVC